MIAIGKETLAPSLGPELLEATQEPPPPPTPSATTSHKPLRQTTSIYETHARGITVRFKSLRHGLKRGENQSHLSNNH